MKKTLILTATSLLTLLVSWSALAEKPVPVTVVNEPEVIVTSLPEQMPYCPCFTVEEVEEVVDGIDLEDLDCIDGRDSQEIAMTRIMNTDDPGDDEVAIVRYDRDFSMWSCLLQYSDHAGVVVDFRDIGLSNAMACRSVIMSTPTWSRCPE